MKTLTERTTIVLADIRAGLEIAAKATDGPWILDDDDQYGDSIDIDNHCAYSVCSVADLNKFPENQANALFIAHFRELGPKGLEALEGVMELLLTYAQSPLRTLSEARVAEAALESILTTWEAKK